MIVGNQAHEVGEGRLAHGQRPRLVEDDGVCLAGDLQRLASLHQYSVLGSDAGSDHHRCRRGQTQRARTADHQTRKRKHQAERRRRLPLVPRRRDHAAAAQPVPHHERQHRDADDGRHEVRRDGVREGLDGHLPALRALHHLDDLGQRGGRSHASHLHEGAGCHSGTVVGHGGGGDTAGSTHADNHTLAHIHVRVLAHHPRSGLDAHGAAQHDRSRSLQHRHRLASDHALVHAHLSVAEHPVCGNGRSLQHLHHVLRLDDLDGHHLLLVRVLDGIPRCWWC
mmetsp:Transcript_18357/g.52455  ORF Transcript_18357/g.52455 Transcript_18357/m.52455 type:complete len:281 (+) Transcript_18357:2937-3779(+)